MTRYIKTYDGRLNSENYLFEMTLEEYYYLTKDRVRDNRYQRKRVRNSASIYGLLKKDLLEGCLMPPIVLAFEGLLNEETDIISQLINSDKNILILDGLQRSYTIIDLIEENNLFDNSLSIIRNNKIRVELYTGINRSSLLYRMLTLNTGQTRMSTRHQIEIIYSDYLTSTVSPEIKLITDLDTNKPLEIGVYAFRDVIEGFTSFIMQDYLLLDRMDILENVRELERLTDIHNDEKDLFATFIETYTFMIKYIHGVVGENLINRLNDYFGSSNGEGLSINPFGKNTMEIFNKSQSLTGFGCAIAKLKERGDIKDFNDIENEIKEINKDSLTEGLVELLEGLEKLRPNAKKIGNAQRYFFYEFFKNLFDSEVDSRDVRNAAKKAWRMYEREFL